ncbi:laccase domain-containing protein, partial [uncultured Campylobacter sp.]|uniref:laccase domain-containing protein n=1 Tax=uncultured Campylobacter sp. TaxID=218934 RepID=UPI0026050271
MAKIEICRENLELVLDGHGVLAGFSTREGGVSVGAYASLNLGDHVGDDPQNVAQNR